MGLGGDATGLGDRHVMMCGGRGSRVAAGRGGADAAGVRVSTPVGWQGGVRVREWAWSDVPQAPSFSPRLLESLSVASDHIQMVLGCGELPVVDSLRMERISQHRFPCALRHPSPRGRSRQFSAHSLRGHRTRPLREGSARAHFRNTQSCVWVQRCNHGPKVRPWPWMKANDRTDTHTHHKLQVKVRVRVRVRDWPGTGGARTSTQTPQHPSQEWRGATETQA